MAKICHLCGTDCSNKPRTKDAKGRYFCKDCYEKALRARKARLAKKAGQAEKPAAPQKDGESAKAGGPGVAETPTQPAGSTADQTESPQARKTNASGQPEFEGSLLEAALADAAADEAARARSEQDDELIPAGEPPKICPKCSSEVAFDSVICTNCGFNFQTGRAATAPGGTTEKDEKKRRAEQRREFVEQFKTAGGIAFLTLVAFGVLLVAAFFVPAASLVYVGAWTLLGAVVWIWVLVDAFRANLLHGLGALIVPLYALIYLFAFCEDARPKLLFGVHVLAAGAFIALAVLLGSENLPLPIDGAN